MTTLLLIDGKIQIDHPTWVLGTFPNFILDYTKDYYCPSFTLTNELVKKGGTNNTSYSSNFLTFIPQRPLTTPTPV
jgi:hypothetical protein